MQKSLLENYLQAEFERCYLPIAGYYRATSRKVVEKGWFCSRVNQRAMFIAGQLKLMRAYQARCPNNSAS